MQKSKLFLSMILEENEPVEMVRRAIDSVKDHVDEIYTTITYKEVEPISSPLLDVLKKDYKANISLFKWTYSFSDARNFAMEQIPKGRDVYFIWMDADDIWQNPQNLRKVVDDMVYYNQSAVFFNYLYMVELDEKGDIREILVEHQRERIIRNDDTFKWIGALHETLIEQRVENVQKILRNECAVIHLSDSSRIDANIDRNIHILENQIQKEERKDPRTIVYLGKAYFDKMNMVEEADQKKIYMSMALELFREYLEGSGKPGTPGYREGSGWSEERSTAWNYVSEIFRLQNKMDEALEALTYAIDEAPQFPKYYIDKAMIYVMKKDIPKAKHWLMLATTIEDPKTTIISTPRDIKLRALEVDYHIKLAEGKLDHAEQDMKMLVDIAPAIQGFKDRLDLVQGLNAANKASQSIVFLARYLEEQKHADRIPDLIRSIPDNLQNEKFVSEMRHKFLPIKNWEKNEIAILCGPGFEPWSPESIKTGLGGSEEAVVYLMQELKKKGWKITVYANPLPAYKAGDYDGVEYKMWWELNPKDNFNVLVLWRGIGFADFDIKSRFTLLWLHDVPNNPDFTEARLQKIDKIAVLSEYHKSLLRMAKNGSFVPMPEDKVFVTSNGMPPVKIKEWHGIPHRLIYMSSIDRGLVYLLNNWQEIKKQVPQAEMNVFYGFQVFDAIHAGNPARMQWKRQILEAMKQEGITYRGRIGHEELEEEINKSGIWAYPTDFSEISCCTGDTLVDMPRNYLTHPSGVPIKELVGKKDFLIWTFNEDTGDFELKNVQWVKQTRKNAKIIKINWTDGTSLRCTPDHKILTYKRGWVEAKDLKKNESVVALKKHIQVQVSVGNGTWPYEHRLIAEKVLGKISKGYHVDHIDGNSFNNSPENLQLLSPQEHAKKTFMGKVTTIQSREKQAKSFRVWAKTNEGRKKLSENGSKRGHKFWNGMTLIQREQFLAKRALTHWNHKVDSIKDAGTEDVYDMLVEDNHNFIAGGVVIHNCISAMKTQALGAIPVVTNFAALKETVRNGLRVDVDIMTEEGQKEYVKSLVGLMKDPKAQENIRKDMMPWAQKYFLWKNVATRWSSLFKGELKKRGVE